MTFIPFAWYLDITPNQMFSDFYGCPIPSLRGLPLWQEHGKQLEQRLVSQYEESAINAF
jgi:hypothetical protein